MELANWHELEASLNLIHLSSAPDTVSWMLEPSGEFSTASLYKALHEGADVFRFKELWKTKVPLKIKIFIRQMARGRIPSGNQV
jgi:hypothetical protein